MDDNYENDNVDYDTFLKYYENDIQRNKKSFANEISQMGNKLLTEINEKNVLRAKKSEKYIEYIMENSDDYLYSDLKTYSLFDIVKIYHEIKNKKKPLLVKIFNYIFFNR